MLSNPMPLNWTTIMASVLPALPMRWEAQGRRFYKITAAYIPDMFMAYPMNTPHSTLAAAMKACQNDTDSDA